jgi:hypothetical protein
MIGRSINSSIAGRAVHCAPAAQLESNGCAAPDTGEIAKRFCFDVVARMRDTERFCPTTYNVAS